MRKLDFIPAKSKDDFRKNYLLHDLAEQHGKNLLIQWGIDFHPFGNDMRFEKVWEKGEDKPDVIIDYGSVSCLLDWKGKRSNVWLANERAINSYINWSGRLNMKVIIVFMVFDEKNNLTAKRFADLSKHKFCLSSKVQWDKNKTFEFESELPEFNKANLLTSINSID